MSPATKVWLKRATIVLIALFGVWFALPRLFGAVFGLSITAVALLGYLAIFAGLPFLGWIVFGAIYKIFLKPYVRVWRINRIRNQRELREATNRHR